MINPTVSTIACLIRRLPFEAGRWRLIPYGIRACERSCLRPTRRSVRTRHGFSMDVDVSEWLGRHIYVTGEYEPATTQVFYQTLKTGGVALDVGANAGYFSLLAAKLVGPSGRVVCVEAVPKIANRLRENIEINRFRQCVVYEVAASNQDGTCEIHVGPDDHLGVSSIREVKNSSATCTVQTKRLDVLLGEMHVDLVKIDVEGAEAHVLEGMTGILERCRPEIILEVTPDYLAALGRSKSSLEATLKPYGYRAFAIDHDGLHALKSLDAWTEPQFNAFFTAAPS